MERQSITIGPIELNWSDWYSWDTLKADARLHKEVKIPNFIAGVYEVKHKDSDERLTIGKASNLRLRIRQGLVKGKTPHSSGKKIRAHEDTSTIVIRWAITDYPAGVEEALHIAYKEKFGRLPKYTQHT